ncbi:MAG: endonuclease/exonuclease/phosphatase family protein [Saprospiraceae bacterium]|nr:endonuclease/exonuclease/phosphatase family protein [Saprospiraceae bacterium]MBK6567107.1 endonuclease/exonuclease/phosphatase family protein [Saprospiraceae bacterium]MBK8081474.1 endonuclease/exonuclease/phosphatase family protein [Saprospiraceae bacterium]MBK8855167.1 endonuclease/exonuclease/phosphatase family protein [Saprospiraceae bacterium]MBK9043983.1 endonuclease/exonuclease/phosphatase family protein [Saprospiraceae bacterium]
MKIITWNCQGAFRNKADAIFVHKPDILVIQECEYVDKLVFNQQFPQPDDVLWFGDNVHKGLCVFSYNGYSLSLSEHYNNELKFIAPVLAKGVHHECMLFAIWANNPGDPEGRYVEQIWKAIEYYDDHLNHPSCILTGDFNSNTIWDRPRRVGNHSAVVSKLAEKMIVSTYHSFFEQEHGKEKHPTFYLYRNREKPYHLDYCFLSLHLNEKVKNVEVGSFEQWKGLSDHVPVIVDIEV